MMSMAARKPEERVNGVECRVFTPSAGYPGLGFLGWPRSWPGKVDSGGAGRSRTGDLEVRNPLLYPSELQPHVPQNCTPAPAQTSQKDHIDSEVMIGN